MAGAPRDSASDVGITDVAEDPNQHDDVGRHGAGVGGGNSGVGEPNVDSDARVQVCGLLPGLAPRASGRFRAA
jgi:hypothetical protein